MNKFIYLITLFIALMSNACYKSGGKCEEPLDIKDSEIVVVFKDKTTNKYLYTEVSPLYNKDSLKVFDERGRSLLVANLLRSAPNNQNEGIYVIGFGRIFSPETDESSFRSEICKDFIVKYAFNEPADTITACFKSEKTKCGSRFQTLKVYHEGQLLDSVNNQISAHITVIKN